MHSPYFPPTVPRSDASLPSTRSGRVPCPRFAGTIKALRLPAVSPAALRCLRLAVPRGWSAVSLPRPQTQVPWTRSSLVRPPRIAACGPWRRSGSPKFPGNPHCPYAMFFDSGRTAAPHHNGSAARPPLREMQRLLHWDFRSSIARLLGSLSTLRRVGPPTATQDSLPGAG
jgi:hypothetical protein